MTPDDPRHATRAGYYAHRGDGEVACKPCKRAAATYEQMRQLGVLEGRALVIEPHRVARRVQALVALGWTHAQIGDRAGISRGYIQYLERGATGYAHLTTLHAISAVYESLSMTLAPESYGSVRARIRAKRRGYAPPLAWDDIDDPDESPKGSCNYRGNPPRRQPAKCGTDSGYYNHRRTKKEPACLACLDAHREYERRRKAAA